MDAYLCTNTMSFVALAVETLAILQESDVFLESSEDDEMDTSTLPSNIDSHV